MASIQFDIDFGDPEGDESEMGCEELDSAQAIIDSLQESGSTVAKALSDWNLLDCGTVTVTYTPDIPADLQIKSIFAQGETIPPLDEVKYAALQAWLKEHQTTATWSDFSRPGD